MLLRDKVALVYGAGGSIGAPTARAFAREGARVFLAGRTLTQLETVAAAIAAAGGAASVAGVDALDEGAVEAHLRAVTAEAGCIDILFNAIGMEDIQGTPLTDMRFDDSFRPIAKAARSQFLTARAAARHMAVRGSGVIMTVTAGPPEAVANIGGFGPACEMIEGLWRGLAAELSPKGVRVIGLRSAGSPDSTDFQAMLAQHAAGGADIAGELGSSTLMGRLPSVAEVAEVAVLVASDRASALTGNFVHVTCGSRWG